MGHTRASVILSFILLVIIVGGLAAGYFLARNEELKLVFLIMVAVIGFLGTIIIIIQLFGRARKLRKRLKQIEKLVAVESLETLKEKYGEIYGLYLKLKEKDKQRFYGRIIQLRERLEGQLKAEKKLQQLLEKAGGGTLEERKKCFDEMKASYEQLPLKRQEKYAAQLAQLKEELEKG
ncbi:MAG: hypothetical protein AABX13_02755 [Nanoarchaeota archaeon]